MKRVIYAALFCSILLGMGTLFGVCAAYFAREYAKEQVRESRRNRAAYKDAAPPLATITVDNGWGK